MSNLKFNKIAAGFLCGGLLIMGGVKVADILQPHSTLDKNAYPIEVADKGDAGAPAVVVDVAAPILAMLGTADLAKGEKLSKKCSACHTFDEGGPAKVGPNLWDIVNTGTAHDGGFSYSSALAGLGGTWDYQSLNGFLHKPKSWLSGTKMNFVGFKKPEDRANVIAWLRTLSASPAALPTAEEIASESAADEITGDTAQ